MAQGLRDAFLERAACLTITDSPSTSAFLTAERLNALSASNPAISPALKATCCSACGCLFVPGWTVTQVRKSREAYADKRVRQPSRQVPRKIVARQCQLCHRESVITIEKPRLLKKCNEMSSNNKPVAAKPLEGSNFAKSTAKQRAKDRKSYQGLQALMSGRGKQKIAASTPQFDLMDFMKA